MITIPFWGYLNTPIALMDVMMADLPHVMYHPPKATREEAENRTIVAQKMRQDIKKGGLRAISGLNLNFDKNETIDGNALLAKLKEK